MFGVEFRHQSEQIPARECPLEGDGDLLIEPIAKPLFGVAKCFVFSWHWAVLQLLLVILKLEQAVFQLSKRGEVIGRQNLPLDDGEIDFDLIEPTGVNRGMNRNQCGPSFLKTDRGFLTAMTRAIVHDPEDTRSRAIRFLAHHLGHQTVKGSDAGPHFTTPEQAGPAHVPGRQIGISSTSLVLMLPYWARFDCGGKEGRQRCRA